LETRTIGERLHFVEMQEKYVAIGVRKKLLGFKDFWIWPIAEPWQPISAVASEGRSQHCHAAWQQQCA
jgi:hypothetical protein